MSSVSATSCADASAAVVSSVGAPRSNTSMLAHGRLKSARISASGTMSGMQTAALPSGSAHGRMVATEPLEQHRRVLEFFVAVVAENLAEVVVLGRVDSLLVPVDGLELF